MSNTYSESNGSGNLGYNGFPVSLNYFTALPDVSILHNPHLVVIFKSLMKKDSTTKEKSLNEFIQLFQDPAYNDCLKDDLLIMSWIQLYPKLAVDNSRSVRVSVHEVQASFLQKIGGKTYSKYFKSCIPVWLHGLFDIDKVVANSCYKLLLKSLQDDKNNIEKLWTIFYKPIINFIMTTICLENHESLSDQRYTKIEDSQSKYERVVNGSVSMLIKLIDIINSGSLTLTKNEEDLINIQNILSSEKLWEFLGKSVGGDSINLPLFRTLITLITKIFEKNECHLSAFVTILNDIKGIYKDISKKFIKNVKIKTNSKSPNSSIVYSNVILPLWNCLVVLTDFSNLSEAERKEFKLKKNFWELGGSKSYSRLLEYLKLGHCQSSPIYYSIIGQFFETLSKVSIDSEDFIEFDNLDDAENIIIKIFCKQIKNLPNKEFRHSAISAAFTVYNLFFCKMNDPGYSTIKILMYTSLDTVSKPSRITNDREETKTLLVETNSNFLKENFTDDSIVNILKGFNLAVIHSIFTENSSQFTIDSFQFSSSTKDIIDNYFLLLKELDSKDLPSSLAQDIIQKLDDGDDIDSALLFHVISLFINYKLSDNQMIQKFIDFVPTFIEENFIEEPLTLLNQLFESDLKGMVNIGETIDNYYTKLSINPSQIPKFLNIVIKHIQINKEDFSDIFNYLFELSKKNNLTDDELDVLLHFFDDTTISNNIIENLMSGEKSRLKLIQISNAKSIDIETHLSDQYCASLMLSAWSNIELPFCKEFVCNSSRKDLVTQSSFEFIYNSSSSDFSKIIELFDETIIPYDKMLQALNDSFRNMNTDLLSIGNPLEFNICLLEPFSKIKGELDQNIIKIGKFLSQYIQKKGVFTNVRFIILCSFVCEFLSDYIFLENESKISNLESILQIKDTLNKCMVKSTNNISLEDVIEILQDDLYSDIDLSHHIFSELNRLCSGENLESFYAARILKQGMDQLSADEGLHWFEKLNINFNKFISNPMKLSVLLLHFSRFVSESSKFDRLRNYVAAEIIGVTKDSKILSDGLKWVTLCLNFLKSDRPYEAIPPHRLMMVLNQISKWMESENSYDEEFIIIRAQLSKFFAGLVINYSSLPDKFWELCTLLIVDNLSMIEGGSDHAHYLELRYATFKLFLTVSKSSNSDAHLGHNEKTSMYQEILGIFISSDIQHSDSILNNQPVFLNHQLLVRIFEVVDFPIELLSGHIESLYSLLSNSKFVNLQRISATILSKLVLINQQEFVVEYQLRKSNLGDDGSDEEFNAVLPQALLSGISLTHSVFDVDHHSTFKFLWSWMLIFDHFKDITYSMRDSYINQLKQNDSIVQLLNIIFDHLDVTDKAFLRKLVHTGNDMETSKDNLIPTYDIRNGCLGESLEFESKLILAHLYYLAFLFLGSHVQSWFKEIRDLQLKSTIENFSKKYITRMIIAKILNEISDSKDKISSKVDNMTIKVNTVTNEIKSEYLIDERIMQMTIKIPETYPLSNVTVEGPSRVGVKENRWKAWLLASQRIISLSNGSISESIELFSKNVNLHFAGFEDCAICYSILHQDNSLPSKVCPTCSNKFHAACLYKWFKSSGASTCPLCRSTFNFRKPRTTTP